MAASTLEGPARRIAVATAVIVALFAIALGVAIWRSDRASDGYAAAETSGRVEELVSELERALGDYGLASTNGRGA